MSTALGRLPGHSNNGKVRPWCDGPCGAVSFEDGYRPIEAVIADWEKLMSQDRDPSEDWGSDEKWASLVPMAYTMMQDVQGRTLEEFGIDYKTRYEWDIDRAEIVFYRKQVPIVQADLQVVGSISRKNGTWLWGWANKSVPSQATDKMSAVRQYGEAQGFRKLTLPKWRPEDGNDGHDVMYVAASILGASATFHDHVGDLALYFTLHNFRSISDDA
jgi:hypothetical protein